jgi:hypothetical protein
MEQIVHYRSLLLPIVAMRYTILRTTLHDQGAFRVDDFVELGPPPVPIFPFPVSTYGPQLHTDHTLAACLTSEGSKGGRGSWRLVL